MKKSTLHWMLAVLIILVVAPTAVKTRPQTKPTIDWTLYYWYDATMTYLNRQQTIANEMNLTGFNENTQSPKTVQEYGFAPSGVAPTPYPPTPLNPGSPDKILFSHP